MNQRPSLLPGLAVAGKYRILRPIGVGGMGSVYLVQHAETEERFALKVLNASVAQSEAARERFRREARTPARIDSDHVCRVVDTDVAVELEGSPFLVMEYLRGQNLQELSDALGALPPREVLVYLRQTAIALDKAHGLGIIHRDLKPENLFLTTRDDGSPCVKILDFGIAKLSGASGDIARVKATQTGDVFGTPLFMSPEQCKSEMDKISPQSDIWALGLITHRLLTGADFWTAETLTHLIAQIAYEPMPKASARGADFGPAYDAWFERCCAREPTERFASAGEALRELGKALGVGEMRSTGDGPAHMLAAERARDAAEGDEPTAVRLQPLHKTSEAVTRDHLAEIEGLGKKKRRGWLTIAAGLAIGAGMGVAAWWRIGGPSESPPPQSSADRIAAAPPTPAPPVSSLPPQGGGSGRGSPTATASTAPSSSAPVRTRPNGWRPPPPPPPPPEDPLSDRH